MNIQSGGVFYDLSHLKTAHRQAEVELRGGFLKVLSLEFRFSNHCYTRTIQPGEVVPDAEKIRDGSEQDPRYRVFDMHRYNLSFHLVGVIDALIQAKGKVFDSPHHNFHHCQVIQAGERIDYVIFMRAQKVREMPKRIQVHVESAYAYDPKAPPFSMAKPQSFFKKLANIWSRA